ncbi:hypothetical protein BDZ88DRAFT_329994 [Geranomyces variabilis]|nr:hypothetical protein BDZ88DRAFT_329994 [Geranomyces variabilis]
MHLARAWSHFIRGRSGGRSRGSSLAPWRTRIGSLDKNPCRNAGNHQKCKDRTGNRFLGSNTVTLWQMLRVFRARCLGRCRRQAANDPTFRLEGRHEVILGVSEAACPFDHRAGCRGRMWYRAATRSSSETSNTLCIRPREEAGKGSLCRQHRIDGYRRLAAHDAGRVRKTLGTSSSSSCCCSCAATGAAPPSHRPPATCLTPTSQPTRCTASIWFLTLSAR